MENKNLNFIQGGQATQGGQAKTQAAVELLGFESQKWVEQGIISEEQRQAILSGYPKKTIEEEHREIGDKTARYILVFAAILIGLAVFSFIAANWQKIGDFSKVAIIIIAMLASYASGWIIKEKGYERTGMALIFLGTIIYGAGIFLIAQIYHIRANWPDGFILWMLGAFGIAYVFESALIYVLGMIVGFVSIFGYPIDIFESFVRFDKFYFTSAILLFIAFVATFVAAIAKRKSFLSSRAVGEGSLQKY